MKKIIFYSTKFISTVPGKKSTKPRAEAMRMRLPQRHKRPFLLGRREHVQINLKNSEKPLGNSTSGQLRST